MILDVHGGPHGFYGYGFNAVPADARQQRLPWSSSQPARFGVATAASSPAWCDCDWGGEDYLDLMAVLDECSSGRTPIRERTGIWGYSYGGFMTAWTIGQTSRFKAAVCGAPCFDLESMYGTSDISHAWGRTQWGGTPHEAARRSPRTRRRRSHIARRTPTLIMQGEADDRCPIGQGEQMFVALSQAGCEVEFARYPGGAHAMLRVARRRIAPTFSARARLVHGSPGSDVGRRAASRSLRRAARFMETSLDDALTGADDERDGRNPASSTLFHDVARDVPAYRAFLAEHEIDPAMRSARSTISDVCR